MPQAASQLMTMIEGGRTEGGASFKLVHLFLLFLIFAAVTAATVMLTQGTRRIPIQMARKTVGNNVTGGNTYMPLKVNFPGVMPIIFAQALLMFPPMLFPVAWLSATGWATAGVK